MITKMKKLTFLIYYKEYEAFLKRMQELGVLHVQTAQEGSVEPTSELEAKLKQTEHVKAWINRLEAMEATDGLPGSLRRSEEPLCGYHDHRRA